MARVAHVVLFLYPLLSPAQAFEFPAGQALHQTHCIACHTSLMNGDPGRIYTRSERRVNSYPGLIAQVRRCALSLGLQWSDADVENVASFLNNRYYQF